MNRFRFSRRPRDPPTVFVKLHERALEELDQPDPIDQQPFDRTLGS